MKTILLLLLTVGSVFAQGTPPVVATNVVKLTPSTRLLWNANPEAVAGYWATMRQGTNEWRSFTTNTFLPVLTLNSNATSGAYSLSVAAVNTFGSEGQPANLSTNISVLPSVVVNLRMEVSFQ